MKTELPRYAALYSQREQMRDALRQCLEYLEKHYDVKDGPDGGVLPNEAMQLGNEIKYVLGIEP